MDQNESLIDNLDPVEDNFDAFNDETFGEMDSTDWESEHEKMITITGCKTTDPNDNKRDNDFNKNNYIKNTSINESRVEDENNFGFDDIVKSISSLGLEDEDFDDPAIMTYARSSKPLNANSMMSDPTRRLSRSSPPPPAFLSYEEFSASPKTQSIWSTTPNDSTLTPTVSSTISSVNMRTLEDIENDLINRNSDHLSTLASVKRPINLEELEANLLRESSNPRMSYNEKRIPNQEMGWSPFMANSMDNYVPNGRNKSEVMPNVETLENMRTEGVSNKCEQKGYKEYFEGIIDDDIIEKASRMMAYGPEVTKEPIDPLLKAQTLSEIERQLMNHNSTQRLKLLQNIAQSHSPNANPNLHPNLNPNLNTNLNPNLNPNLDPNLNPNQSPNAVTTHPVVSHMAQSQIPLGHPLNRGVPPQYQMRFANAAQNRVNDMYNRQPVRQLMPGMVPGIGRTMFPPALIPNSQRIFPFAMQSRPLVHPLLHPLHLQQQQQHLHQQYLQQRQHLYHNSRQRYNSYDENTSDDEYAGLMTQREKEWLIKIQLFQTELKDPYVDDYYYVTYISRKIAAKAATDKDNKTTPSLLLPERPKPAPEPETPKYIPIQFEGSLGKIQVSNVNCPRKLLDCKLNKTDGNTTETMGETKVITKSEVQKFRKLLLDIEKLYVVLINIDDEDKRIGALPEEARIPHLETRRQLCDKLFKGLTNETNEKISLEVVQIKKGLALLFRSLSYLSDERQRAVIISDLLNANNFRQYVIKPKDRLDYGLMLVNAIRHIKNDEILEKIVDNINNISVIIKSEVSIRLLTLNLLLYFSWIWFFSKPLEKRRVLFIFFYFILIIINDLIVSTDSTDSQS